jgi:metal-responsive CopG/Arc/MetJ family transcriptional regulator
MTFRKRFRVEDRHSYTYPVFMKNVTIALDESLLREARRIAADRSTTLNAMIREFLEELARRESHALEARRRIVELCRETKAEVGSRTWSRDELHER